MSGIYKAARGAAGDLYRSYTLHHLYPGRYREAVKQYPVEKDLVVFLEVRESSLSDNFRLIRRALEQKGGFQLKLVCIREGMEDPGTVQRRCLQAIPLLARASCIFVSDSSYFLSCLPLRSETTVIQTWHACGAFKKWGWSTADSLFGAGKRHLERFPVHKNFSWVTVSSPEVAWAYAEAFHMEDRQDRIVATGVSRTDVFFRPEYKKRALKRLYEALPQAEGKKVILYAPTFRGKVGLALSPKVLDYGRLHEQTGGDYIFLVKHHPFVKQRPRIKEEWSAYTFDVSDTISIEDLILVSDMCISDYSSLVFEYSLTERPMIFLAYDLEDYYDWRGFYYPYEELAPGPIVRSTEETGRAILDLAENFDPSRVRAFREKYMGSCDGHATERVLQLMDRG